MIEDNDEIAKLGEGDGADAVEGVILDGTPVPAEPSASRTQGVAARSL